MKTIISKCFWKYINVIMLILTRNDELLEKYNEIGKKLSNIIKKEFNCEPAYNKKCLKTKINLIREKST